MNRLVLALGFAMGFSALANMAQWSTYTPKVLQIVETISNSSILNRLIRQNYTLDYQRDAINKAIVSFNQNPSEKCSRWQREVFNPEVVQNYRKDFVQLSEISDRMVNQYSPDNVPDELLTDLLHSIGSEVSTTTKGFDLVSGEGMSKCHTDNDDVIRNFNPSNLSVAPPSDNMLLIDFAKIPLATPAKNPNHVNSPYDPFTELDVTGLEKGSLAKDPTNGKIFKLPSQ